MKIILVIFVKHTIPNNYSCIKIILLMSCLLPQRICNGTFRLYKTKITNYEDDKLSNPFHKKEGKKEKPSQHQKEATSPIWKIPQIFLLNKIYSSRVVTSMGIFDGNSCTFSTQVLEYCFNKSAFKRKDHALVSTTRLISKHQFQNRNSIFRRQLKGGEE